VDLAEEWKPLVYKGVETDKLISNSGQVKDAASGVLRQLCDNGGGYLSVLVYSYKIGRQHRSKREYIHRLVAMHFLDNPQDLPQVNHIDCDKSNNRVNNLEWVSGSKNIKEAHKSGRMLKRTTFADIQILTKDAVIYLYTQVKLYKEGISATARNMGIARTTASSIINKRSRWDITNELDELFKNRLTSNSITTN